MSNTDFFPLLPLRDIVVFPGMIAPLFVGRDKSIKALNEVMKTNKKIVLVTQKNAEMDTSTWLQFASLSKTVGSAMAIELFNRQNISLDALVNTILTRYGTLFRLYADAANMWGNQVTFRMLLSHTAALGMHYVNGISAVNEFPPVLDLLRGRCESEYGYQAVCVHEEPGTRFSYSGASFLVLQHILEIMETKELSDVMELLIEDKEGVVFSINLLFLYQTIRCCHNPIGY